MKINGLFENYFVTRQDQYFMIEMRIKVSVKCKMCSAQNYNLHVSDSTPEFQLLLQMKMSKPATNNSFLPYIYYYQFLIHVPHVTMSSLYILLSVPHISPMCHH